DRLGPSVRLLAPKQAFPGTQVTLIAEVQDNVAVSSVAFVVDDGQPVDDAEAPYTRQVTIPSVVSPGANVTARAVARDAAGNEGSATAKILIVTTADADAPTIELLAAANTAPGASVVLTAIAADNVAVSGVTFRLGGSPIGIDPASPYQAEFEVPAEAGAGSTILVTAQATDDAGNTAEASRSILVVADARDESPPSVTLHVPPEIAAGRVLNALVDAHDENGIADVQLSVNGALFDTDVAQPYEFAYPVSVGIRPDTEIELTAVARDFAGLTGTAKAVVIVRGPPVLTQGVISGEAYDDVAGLPLAGATVRLLGTDDSGAPYFQTATSDTRGRFALQANPGQAVIEIAKPGWTTSRRTGQIVAGQALEIVDGRLTEIPKRSSTVSAVLGGTLVIDNNELRIPAGAVADAATLTFAPLTQQGLIGLLPAGWSPVAAADVRSATPQFTGNLTLALSPLVPVAPVASLVFARFDEATSAWRAIGGAVAQSVDQRLEHELGSAGQYAWLLADTEPAAPPLPDPGALMAGVASPQIPVDANTTISPQPKI